MSFSVRLAYIFAELCLLFSIDQQEEQFLMIQSNKPIYSSHNSNAGNNNF